MATGARWPRFRWMVQALRRLAALALDMLLPREEIR